MNHHYRVFYDSTQPLNIHQGSLAAVYVNLDGSYAWTRAEVDRMLAVFGISESTDPKWAEYARCAAVEPGADTPARIAAFLHERVKVHHHDDAMAYVNQGNWQAVEEAVMRSGIDCDWWVAAPGMSPASADELFSPVKKKKPVAVQIQWGSATDMSIITAPLHFTPAHEFKATKR